MPPNVPMLGGGVGYLADSLTVQLHRHSPTVGHGLYVRDTLTVLQKRPVNTVPDGTSFAEICVIKQDWIGGQ